MIIDSHCHLDYEPMFSSLDEVINRAKKSKVNLMLTISVADNKYNIILDIIKRLISFTTLLLNSFFKNFLIYFFELFKIENVSNISFIVKKFALIPSSKS